jgi:thiol:disulfide interchange protein DsbD
MRALIFLTLLFPSLAFGAVSNIFTTPRDTVSLVSETNAPANGQITLALNVHLAPGWHIYWSNPGDAGLPPQITLSAPAQAGPFTYPPPELLVQGPVAAYVLSGDVVLPFTATSVSGTVTATANWLVCSDICVPEHAAFTLALTGGSSSQAGLFNGPLIVPSPFPARIAPDGTLSLTGPTAAQIRTARFFPNAPGAIINIAAQPLRFTDTGIALTLSPAPGFDPKTPLPGIIELTDKSGAMQALALTATPGPAPAATPLALWLAAAFLGGLILNLMPCVFPILAMKALSLVRLGGAHRGQIRREAFGYTAGVLAAFLALGFLLLGIRALGNEAGWGFQFQSPIFIALIAWLIFCAGLNLAGVFEISGLSNIGARLARHGSFFTGLLAVVVATPCTAPFMGGAIAAALAAPPIAACGIFLALGLGLAAPFLLIALIPALASALPRPGAWMRHLQRALSLPMFATFAWLVWVEHFEANISGVLLLLLGATALTAALAARRLRPLALIAALTLPFFHTTQAAPLTLPGAQPYSPATLAALRGSKTPVFIDLTAAWCVTCLVNERTTLESPKIQSAFAARHIQILVGDWTNRDAAITALLEANHRDGVPLYLYYPAGAQTPNTLPQILTPEIVLRAINTSHNPPH